MRKISKGLKSQMDSGQKRDKSRLRAGRELRRRQREKKKYSHGFPVELLTGTQTLIRAVFMFLCVLRTMFWLSY